LNCWQKNENAQCLRVECESGRQFLFPYGYFKGADFVPGTDADTIELFFKIQNRIVSIKGRQLHELFVAFQNLSVEWIKSSPPKYRPLTKNNSTHIESIQVATLTEKPDANGAN